MEDKLRISSESKLTVIISKFHLWKYLTMDMAATVKLAVVKH